MKNSPFLVLGRLEQRDGQRLRFGAAAQLFGWSPIGATLVERIQDDIASRRVVKPLHKLAGWVVNDGRITPAADLPEHLEQSADLPAPVSPMICMCCASARTGMRSIGFMSSVLKPMPSPLTVLLNCCGVSISGPFSRRPYFNCFCRCTSLMRRTVAGSGSASASSKQRRFKESEMTFSRHRRHPQIDTQPGIHIAPLRATEERENSPVPARHPRARAGWICPPASGVFPRTTSSFMAVAEASVLPTKSIR